MVEARQPETMQNYTVGSVPARPLHYGDPATRDAGAAPGTRARAGLCSRNKQTVDNRPAVTTGGDKHECVLNCVLKTKAHTQAQYHADRVE